MIGHNKFTKLISTRVTKLQKNHFLLNIAALVQSNQPICSAQFSCYLPVKEIAYFVVDRSSFIPTLPNQPYQPIKAKHNQNIARVRNCPDVTILNSLLGLMSFFLFVLFAVLSFLFVFLPFCLFV